MSVALRQFAFVPEPDIGVCGPYLSYMDLLTIAVAAYNALSGWASTVK